MTKPLLYAGLMLACLLLARPGAAAAEVAHTPFEACLLLIEAALEAEDRQSDDQLEARLAATSCWSRLMQAGASPRRLASLLEAAANSPERRPEVKRELLARAAQAWLKAGDIAQAERVITRAGPDLLFDREIELDYAVILGQSGRYWDAIAALDRLLKRQPFDTEALLLRAAAHRQTGNLSAAARDAEAGLKLQEDHPGLLLERGNIALRAGAADHALAAWRLARGAAEPGSLEHEAAASQIQRLEAVLGE